MDEVDRGHSHVHDYIFGHVSNILAKDNGTSLLELWNNDDRINKVTFYDLLHMQSGIQDID